MSKKKSSIDIEAIVAKAQKGNEKSFVFLYDHFFDLIFRYVSFRVSPESREDVVGDIFYKVVHNLKKYKQKPGASFKSWIYAIAHNQIIDFYRKQKELLGSDQIEENFFNKLPDKKGKKPDEHFIKKEETETIKKALKKLSPIHREILELKFLEEFSNKEISKIIGKTEGNIRIMQLRALREIRKFF